MVDVAVSPEHGRRHHHGQVMHFVPAIAVNDRYLLLTAQMGQSIL